MLVLAWQIQDDRWRQTTGVGLVCHISDFKDKPPSSYRTASCFKVGGNDCNDKKKNKLIQAIQNNQDNNIHNNTQVGALVKSSNRSERPGPQEERRLSWSMSLFRVELSRSVAAPPPDSFYYSSTISHFMHTELLWICASMWSHSVRLLKKNPYLETPSHDSSCIMLFVLAGLWCSVWVQLSLDGPLAPRCLGIPFRLLIKDANYFNP